MNKMSNNKLFLTSITILALFFCISAVGSASATNPVANPVLNTTAPTASANYQTGYYNTTKSVKLTMTQTGNIYYTKNGTTPTINSTLYTEPIIIKSTTTLKYLAVNLSGIKSQVYTKTYTIDTIPPKVSTTSPTNKYIYASLTAPITIKFSENIVAGVNYSKIYVKNLSTCKIVTTTKEISGNTLTIKDAVNRINKDIYLVYLPACAVKDLAGNNLAKAYAFGFVTGSDFQSYSGHSVSFNYPLSWETQAFSQQGCEIILGIEKNATSQEAPSFQIQITPFPSGMTDQDAIQAVSSNPDIPGYKLISQTKTTINGNTAYEYFFTINDKDVYNQIMEDQQINIVKDNKIFTMDLIAPYATFSNEKSTYATIINSFKIT